LNEQQEFRMPMYPKKIDNLISEELEGMDETIWVDTLNGTSFSLNAVASAILELCDGEHTDQDIAAIISETLSEKIEHVLVDTQGMIITFYRNGILQLNDG